jgi:predicted O-methyltransferase YrrM
VVRAYRHETWDTYRMDTHDPHRVLEPLEDEIEVVKEALDVLCEAGVLPHTEYDHGKMLAHREAVRELFEIPWTAITPRMQRLLYAINAIIQPANMIAGGVFCGNTFISNAGAGAGPGACYTARNLIGVEIQEDAAELAERNVRRIDPTGVARVLGADAVEVVSEFAEPINLLYVDADGHSGSGKGIYYDIAKAAYPRMPEGAVALAHNSLNGGKPAEAYLEYVRDEANFRASVNVIMDIEGLEVSVK